MSDGRLIGQYRWMHGWLVSLAADPADVKISVIAPATADHIRKVSLIHHVLDEITPEAHPP